MDSDLAVRIAAFAWLTDMTRVHGDVLPRTLLEKGFEHQGTSIPLVAPQGVFKPRSLQIPNAPKGPYNDAFDTRGFLQYRYRGTDPRHQEGLVRSRRDAKRTGMKKLFLVICFFSLCSSAFGTAREEAIAAWNKGDYPGYIKVLREMAESGDVDAQTSLGNCYSTGRGVPPNLKEAVTWYRKAVRARGLWGAVHAGKMIAWGSGVPQDFQESVKWVRKAAQQGYFWPQGDLGVSYFKGEGVHRMMRRRVSGWTYRHVEMPGTIWGSLTKTLYIETRTKAAAKLTPDQRAEVEARCKKWQEDFDRRHPRRWW